MMLTIPWSFAATGATQVWRWESPHFVATVIGEGVAFQWDIADKVAAGGGAPMPLTSGIASTFEEAEREIRETVGKAYPRSFGYAEFAGPLATTFEIANGDRVDLGAYHGSRVIVTVGIGGGETVVVTGQAAVEHYDLRVAQDDGSTVRIRPIRIRGLIFERGGLDPARAAKTPVGRMFSGRVTPGCTGTPGFMADTVEHNNGTCPVHEYGR